MKKDKIIDQWVSKFWKNHIGCVTDKKSFTAEFCGIYCTWSYVSGLSRHAYYETSLASTIIVVWELRDEIKPDQRLSFPVLE